MPSSRKLTPLSPTPPPPPPIDYPELVTTNPNLFDFEVESAGFQVENLRRLGIAYQGRLDDMTRKRRELLAEQEEAERRGRELKEKEKEKARLGTDVERQAWRSEYNAIIARLAEIESRLATVLESGNTLHANLERTRLDFIAGVRLQLEANARRRATSRANPPIEFGPMLLDTESTKRGRLSPMADSPPPPQPPAKIPKTGPTPTPKRDVGGVERMVPPCDRCRGMGKDCERDVGTSGPCRACKKDKKGCSGHQGECFKISSEVGG
jgi:hypothetical protein